MTIQPNSNLILCSTPRLAVSLQQHHQREQLENGLNSVVTSRCYDPIPVVKEVDGRGGNVRSTPARRGIDV
jgi:hypothetical protein